MSNQPAQSLLEAVCNISTTADFRVLVDAIRHLPGYTAPKAFGLGFAVFGQDHQIRSIHFPFINCDQNPGSAALFQAIAAEGGSGSARFAYLDEDQIDMLRIAFAPFMNDKDPHANIESLEIVEIISSMSFPENGRVSPIVVFIDDLDSPANSTEEAYFHLALLASGKLRRGEIPGEGLALKIARFKPHAVTPGAVFNLGQGCRVDDDLLILPELKVRVFHGSLEDLANGFPGNDKMHALYEFVHNCVSGFHHDVLLRQERCIVELNGANRVTIWMYAEHLSDEPGLCFRFDDAEDVVDVIPMILEQKS